MWSSLSGAGRFTSRAGSGLLVDMYGFNMIAALACGLQLAVALATLMYLVMCECSLVTRPDTTWDDVTIVEQGRRRDDKVSTALYRVYYTIVTTEIVSHNKGCPTKVTSSQGINT